METYIAILRGINVGKKQVVMADLKRLLETAGLSDVQTYIQSGNVVFRHEKQDEKTMARRLETLLTANYGFDVPVLVRSAREWDETLAANPFLQRENTAPDKLHVTFLADAPEPALLEKLETVDFKPDEFAVVGRDVYLYCPDGYGRTKLSNTFFEKKLKVSATTRNWATVNKLGELSRL